MCRQLARERQFEPFELKPKLFQLVKARRDLLRTTCACRHTYNAGLSTELPNGRELWPGECIKKENGWFGLDLRNASRALGFGYRRTKVGMVSLLSAVSSLLSVSGMANMTIAKRKDSQDISTRAAGRLRSFQQNQVDPS